MVKINFSLFPLFNNNQRKTVQLKLTNILKT